LITSRGFSRLEVIAFARPLVSHPRPRFRAENEEEDEEEDEDDGDVMCKNRYIVTSYDK